MYYISCALKRKVGKPLLFKQTVWSRFTCLACQLFSFHAKKSLDRERPFSLALRVVSLLSCLSRRAPLVTRVVICVSRAFCSTDQEKRETARGLFYIRPRFLVFDTGKLGKIRRLHWKERLAIAKFESGSLVHGTFLGNCPHTPPLSQH